MKKSIFILIQIFLSLSLIAQEYPRPVVYYSYTPEMKTFVENSETVIHPKIDYDCQMLSGSCDYIGGVVKAAIWNHDTSTGYITFRIKKQDGGSFSKNGKAVVFTHEDLECKHYYAGESYVDVTYNCQNFYSGNNYFNVVLRSSDGAHYNAGTIIIKKTTISYFEIEPENEQVSASAGSSYDYNIQKISITSTEDWTAYSTVSWLSIETTNGSGNGYIHYSFTENTSLNSREGKIILSAPGFTDRIFTITQAGATPASYLTINPSGNINVNENSGNNSISVESNIYWSATSNQSWLSINSGSNGNGNGTIYYSYSANTSTEPRTAKITVSGDGINRTLTITQAGSTPASYLTINPSGNINVNENSGNNSIYVNSNIYWSATSNQSWLSINSGINGNGNGTIYYSYSGNTSTEQRTAKITVSGDGINRTLTITQQGTELTIELEPCPTVGEYCGCNSSETGFNLKILNYFENIEIGTGWGECNNNCENVCNQICNKPPYGSNIPIKPTFVWREVIGATEYILEIANNDGSLITGLTYKPNSLILSNTAYEENIIGENISRKLTQALEFDTEYKIKLTVLDNNQNVLGCETLSFRTCEETRQDSGCSRFKKAHASFNNIIAFCNDKETNQCNSGHNGYTKYQCTNYINRYYASIYGIDMYEAGFSGLISASNYLNEDYYKDYFMYFNNDGTATSPPKVGDIVVWTASCSHVAVVTGVNDNNVTILQQNNVDEGVPDFFRDCDFVNNILTDPSDDCIAGWMRLKTINIDLRETENNQVALPTRYDEIDTISNSTPTFQWTHIPNASYKLYIKKKRNNDFCFEKIAGIPFPIKVSASENNNTGYSLGKKGIVLEQGEYLCRVGAKISNVGTIWSERFYFNINSDNSTILPVIPANKLTIIARTTSKKSNKSVIAANVRISRQNSNAWELLGTTNQNGNLFAEIYPPLVVGEQIQAQTEGYVTQQITITNEILQNGIININLEEDLSSDFIRNPRMTILEYAPIITQNPITVQVDAENYTDYTIFTINGEEEEILYSGTPSTNSTTITFEHEGLHNINVRFSNDNHSVEINQYVNYQLSTTPENSYNVSVISDANSIGATVYINKEFVKTIDNVNEIFSVPAGTNKFNFIKNGYSTHFETTTDETTINLSLTATDVEDIDVQDKILIYPNPANDLIYVNLDNYSNKQIELRLFDAMNRVVKTLTTNQRIVQINTSDLTSGVYYISVILDNNQIITKKVVIMK